MPKGRGKHSNLPTSLFIKAHLQSVGEDYPYHMFQVLEEERKDARRLFLLSHKAYTEQKSYIGSYQNFRNYIWWLKRLNLIEPSGKTEVSMETDLPQERIYYRLVRKNIGKTMEWTNPRKALYPYSYRLRGRP